MLKALDHQVILCLKKQLIECIIKNDYNLQAAEVLDLSERLDELMLPVFEKQLDFYNQYLKRLS